MTEWNERIGDRGTSAAEPRRPGGRGARGVFSQGAAEDT